MSDWIEHNGGPQPVDDDVWVSIHDAFEGVQADRAGAWGWDHERYKWCILNQHLIDAARLEGIRLGLEAAEKIVWKDSRWMGSDGPRIGDRLCRTLRNLNPDTIAKEAGQ